MIQIQVVKLDFVQWSEFCFELTHIKPVNRLLSHHIDCLGINRD